MTEPPVTCRWAEIEGYDGDYIVTVDAQVWSKKSGKWRRLKPWLEHGHATVELWRNGQRTRRRVAVLVRRAFDVPSTDDRDLMSYLEHRYGLTADEAADVVGL